MQRCQEKFPLLLAASLLIVLSPILAGGQVTTADLVGTVKDNNGAVVRGAKVTLTNEATGVSRSAVTGEDGNHIFTCFVYFVCFVFSLGLQPNPRQNNI